MDADLATADAIAQAELVRAGTCTPLELVDAAIARIEALNPRVNAVIHPMFEKARAAAADPSLPDGPFRGVPFVVKDAVCHTAGDPHHVGMRFLRDRDWRARFDTHLARRLRQAGLVFVGRTNTPELAASVTTEPLAYGPARNPWDLDRSTGGSSGGTAAAVASGMVPAGHGNDMGGSIRIPASACGLVGLKPSRARTSLGPELGEYWGMLTHEGVLTTTVRDTAALLDAIAGPWPGDPYSAPPPARPFAAEVGAEPGRLRVGVRTSIPGGDDQAAPDCVAAVESTARLLEAQGHIVEPAWPAALDHMEVWTSYVQMISCALARDLDRWQEATGDVITADDVEPGTWVLAEGGRATSGAGYLEAVEIVQRHGRALAGWWETDGFDLLLTPTLAQLPPTIGEVGPNADSAEAYEVMARISAFVVPWNITGQPAISLPPHAGAGGVPVGVQLVAPYGREDLLLRVAAQLEQAAPWSQRMAPVHA